MNVLVRYLTLWLLLLAVTSWANAQVTLKPTKPTTSAPTIQPIQTQPLTDLAFSTPLVKLLKKSGLTIMSVQGSVYMSMFQSTDKAAWIETNQGIVEAVFFVDPAEVKRVQVTRLASETGRYKYKVQAPPPTLSQDVTIDAAFPLYFTMQRGMLVITSSAELDKTLKRILSE